MGRCGGKKCQTGGRWEVPAGPAESSSCALKQRLRVTGTMRDGANDLHNAMRTQRSLALACQPKLGTARESCQQGLNLVRATNRFSTS